MTDAAQAEVIYLVQTFKVIRDGKEVRVDAYADAAQPFTIYTKFQGYAQDKFKINGQSALIPYNFPINATNIREAFERYEAYRIDAGNALQDGYDRVTTRARLSGG